MHRGTWKNHERLIARYFDSERNPLSGGNSKHSRSDSLHPKLYIEVKSGKSTPKTWDKIAALYDETRNKAELEHKFPVVVLKPWGTSAPIRDWTCYFRGWDGGLYETLVAAPLWVIKEALSEGTLPTLRTT